MYQSTQGIVLLGKDKVANSLASRQYIYMLQLTHLPYLSATLHHCKSSMNQALTEHTVWSSVYLRTFIIKHCTQLDVANNHWTHDTQLQEVMCGSVPSSAASSRGVAAALFRALVSKSSGSTLCATGEYCCM